jgi:hypothetical protein
MDSKASKGSGFVLTAATNFDNKINKIYITIYIIILYYCVTGAHKGGNKANFL